MNKNTNLPLAKEVQLTSKAFRIQSGKSNIFYLGVIAIIAAIAGSVIFFISSEQAEITNTIFKKKRSAVNMEETIRKQPPGLPSGISMAVPEKVGDLPEGFVDIPLNGKKEIIRSYTLNYPGSTQKQQVVDFISSLPMAENFKFYKTWSTQNNWTILYELETTSQAILNIKKEKAILAITITSDKADPKLSEINISE